MPDPFPGVTAAIPATITRLLLRMGVIDSGMAFAAIRQGLAAALLALFLAVFALAPAADALTCGPEETSAASSAVVVDQHSNGSDDDGGLGHPACAHGHCHHSGTAAPLRSEILSGVSIQRAPLVIRPSHRLASRSPAGPERPPRV